MKNYFNQPLLLLTFLVFSSLSFSQQLDSVHVDLELKNYSKVNFGDTLNGVYFDASIYTNDIAFFGRIDINVFEVKTNAPNIETRSLVNTIKLSRQQLSEDNIEDDKSFRVPIYGIKNESDYEIRVFVRDNQGNNYPMIKLLRSVN